MQPGEVVGILFLQKEDLKTGRAWSMKENFRHFWECSDIEEAKVYFQSWYTWTTRSQLAPIVKVAAMLKRHLEGVLAYITHRITNAMSEASTVVSNLSKVQLVALGTLKIIEQGSCSSAEDWN